MSTPKTLSLVDELRAIEKATEGALLLLDGVGARTIEADQEAAARAVLAIVVSRLRQVGQAIRGTLDPEALWSGHNAVTGAGFKGDDPDVRLQAQRRR